jgi:hypothetical protein
MLCIWGQVRTYSIVDLPAGRAAFQSEASAARYVWLMNNTQPGDVVWEPYRTMVNFPLKLQNPTSFALLRNNNYTTANQVERIVNELNARPPRYILWNAAWSDPVRSADDHLGPLYELLTTNYERQKTFDAVFDIHAEAWVLKTAKTEVSR